MLRRIRQTQKKPSYFPSDKEIIFEIGVGERMRERERETETGRLAVLGDMALLEEVSHFCGRL